MSLPTTRYVWITSRCWVCGQAVSVVAVRAHVITTRVLGRGEHEQRVEPWQWFCEADEVSWVATPSTIAAYANPHEPHAGRYDAELRMIAPTEGRDLEEWDESEQPDPDPDPADDFLGEATECRLCAADAESAN